MYIVAQISASFLSIAEQCSIVHHSHFIRLVLSVHLILYVFSVKLTLPFEPTLSSFS